MQLADEVAEKVKEAIDQDRRVRLTKLQKWGAWGIALFVALAPNLTEIIHLAQHG